MPINKNFNIDQCLMVGKIQFLKKPLVALGGGLGGGMNFTPQMKYESKAYILYNVIYIYAITYGGWSVSGSPLHPERLNHISLVPRLPGWGGSLGTRLGL